MRRLLPPLLLPSLLAVTSSAHADTFSSTRSKALVEKSHTIHVTLRRDHAELRVTRTVHNGGKQSDQATFHVMTATDTVATGLRTQAIIDGKAHWFVGELMEAEAAAKKYRELTGIGGYYPKDPALLSWRDDGHLALQVFPCPPEQDKVVEYTLLAPMRYEDGRYLLDLPAMGSEGLAATATFSADDGSFIVDGKKAPERLTLASAHTIEQTVDLGATIDGALAAVPFAADKALFSYHLDVPSRLSEVPKKARIVIAIDASHSFGAARIASARAAAIAYLSHFDGDDVEVEILAFGRKVESLGKGFQSLALARATLTEATITPRNGSELGLALERAGSDLAGAPADAARRVVMFTDLRTRTSLAPATAKSSVPFGATLHIVTVESGKDDLERDDADPWAKLPRSTGGVLWHAAASTGGDTTAVRQGVFEQLARPLRIDAVSLSAGGVSDLDAPSVLLEGQGLEDHRVVSKLASHITLTGELWSTHVERTLEPDAAYGRRRAALAFGTDLLHGFDDAELMRLAVHGRAVTPVTSYLAIEPGVRPSIEGLDWNNNWEGLIGDAFGAGGLGLAGFGEGGGGRADPTDYAALLRALGEPELAPCKVEKGSVTLTVESTFDEIAAVALTVADDDAKRSKASCLTERLWFARLPADFAAHALRMTSTEL
jgi:hypothetical protein